MKQFLSSTKGSGNWLAILLMIVMFSFTLSCGGSTAPVTNDPVVEDTTDPVPGDRGEITVSGLSANALTLSWEPATDEETAQLNLEYAVYQSTEDNISTVEGCESGAESITLLQEFTPGATTETMTLSVSNLEPNTPYYFNVVVQDKAGHKAAYNSVSATTDAVPDTEPPWVANSGIMPSSISSYSLVLCWDAATDNVTAQDDLEYAVYMSESGDIADVDACSGEKLKIDFKTYVADNGVIQATISGLSADTQYYFNVVVKDAAENKAAYTMRQVTTGPEPDTEPPTVANKIITATDVTTTTLTLSWNPASDNITDQDQLQYAVYQSDSDNMTTPEECLEEGVVMIMNFTTNSLTFDVTNLKAGRTYYFNVVVKDAAENKTAYTVVHATTLADTTPPMVADKTITATASYDYIRIAWAAATDDVTAQADLEYAIYRSETDDIGDLDACLASGKMAHGFKTYEYGTEAHFGGLFQGTTHYFNVVVKDESGNKTAYTMVHATTLKDTIPPTPGGDGAITAGGITANSITLSWEAASDNVESHANLGYIVYKSTSNNISTVQDCKDNGTQIGSIAYGIKTKTVEGLDPGTTYYFNVLVKDGGGNEAVYTMTEGITTAD